MKGKNLTLKAITPCLLVICLTLAVSAQRASDAGRVYFIKFENDSYTVNSINPDGSNEQFVTESSDGIFSPSPDGNQILFLRARNPDAAFEDRQHDIYLMGSNGSDLVRVTNSGENYSPTWSPSGESIAFIHEQENEYSVEFLSRDQPDTVESLFHTTSQIGNLDWSPDESQLVFTVCDTQLNCDLGTIHIVSRESTILTSSFQPNVLSATWSNALNLIGFIAYEQTDILKSNIYTIDVVTGETINVTNFDADYRSIAWSAENDFIVFASNQQGNNWEIYRIKRDTGEQINLTNNPNLQDGIYGLDVSHIGDVIAYSTGPIEGGFEIYTMSLDGTDTEQITIGGMHKLNPVWTD